MADPPGLRPAAPPRPVVLVSVLMMAFATAPYLRAHLAPPPGTAFTGSFWFIDDAYNYLSYVQQAEDGALAFRNKLVTEPHRPALVNPEWWLVGVLSRALGRSPFLAYRLFALFAIVALVAGIRAWLRDAGLPETHALAALLLVCVGGGAGAACLLLGRPATSCLDVSAGLYPFLEVLANPHFVAGTALLLWSLRAFRDAHERGGAGRLAVAAGLGSALALTRPYDFVLLAAIRSLVVVLTDPPRRWLRHAAAMALLAPAVAYDAWVFYGLPAFASLAEIEYAFPAAGAFLGALAPPAVVAGAAFAVARVRGRAAVPPASDRPGRVAALHFGVWLLLALAMTAARPVNFALQFLVGVGVPLLALAALALAPFPPAVTGLATLALSSAAAAALRITLLVSPAWYVPAERMAAALALRAPCRPGDVAVAPPDIGLYVGGLTACTPYVSHRAAPGFHDRDARVREFYRSPDPAGGAAFLDGVCAAHVVLPASSAAAHAGAAPFRPVALAGSGPRAIAVQSRTGPPPCAPAP